MRTTLAVDYTEATIDSDTGEDNEAAGESQTL